ncbi:ERG4/ERG24 ergosterol biosynthesis-like protein [Thermothelomyces heterothallicus CBS 202.75]|uniref:ERG4/ERG24 ergosterol biosynthesis-like protein n=1 Tax=Thermothelomyces heterothallicus CBS 202.75 TaxID=1149848 RepID=UPI003744266C
MSETKTMSEEVKEVTVTKADLKSKDFVPRGNKSSSPFNTSLYLGLRAVDCCWQYLVLSQGYGSYVIRLLRGAVIPTAAAAETGVGLIDDLGLSGFRLVLLLMNVLAAAKHFWFVLRVAEEAWTLPGAIIVGLDNIFFDTLNNFLFLCAATSAASHPSGETLSNPYLLAGFSLFVLGIGLECACEIDRKRFKTDKRNKGKPYTGGLFAVVRHPNYAAFTIWRAGLAVATSGITAGLLIATFFTWDFSNRAVPALDEYCPKRYGQMWADYKKKTRFTLIPYLTM